MKSFTIFIALALFLICTQFALSQDTTSELVKGKYYEDEQVELIEGTWIGTSGADSLVIRLRSQKQYLGELDIYIDELVGYHSYWRDGELIESSQGAEELSIQGAYIKEKPSFHIKGMFFNIYNDEFGYFTMELESPEDTTAMWHLSDSRGVIFTTSYDSTDKSEESKFRVPQKMVLRKIE